MERIDKSNVTTAKDVEAMKLINAYANFLKKSGKIELPKLHDLMRTKVFSEYSPYDNDWYFIRCGKRLDGGFIVAAIARHLYMRPNVGVKSLRDAFGSRHRNGVRHQFHDRVCAFCESWALGQRKHHSSLPPQPRGDGTCRVFWEGRTQIDQGWIQGSWPDGQAALSEEMGGALSYDCLLQTWQSEAFSTSALIRVNSSGDKIPFSIHNVQFQF